MEGALKRVVLTGASSGIGETIARRLAAEGHQVALMARRVERVREIVGELDGAIAGAGDVDRVEDCEAAVQGAVEAFGGLDTLVNAAGTWVEEPLHAANYEQIKRFVDTDVSGALQITRAALPELMKGGGRLVHINGLQGLIRVRPPVLYATVEAAVRGLCESLRWEAAPHGVHVGFITLGSVANTEMPTPDLSVLHTDRNRDRLSRDEVADAVLFMLSRPEGVNVDEMVLTPLQQILWNT